MRRFVVGGVMFGAAIFAARPAHACEIDRVIGESEAPPSWRGAVERLAHDLESSSECAVLTVTLGQDGALIDATMPDGRVAERSVTTPSELSSVTFGLLASIPIEQPSPPPAPVPIPLEETVAAPVREAPPLPVRDKIQPGLAFSLGSRFEVPFGVVATEVEIRTELYIHRWIVSAATFAAPVGTRIADDAIQYREWGFGGEAGRWIPIGTHGGGIAWTAGPGFSSTSFHLHAIHRERNDFAVQTVARYVAPFGSTWHPTVAAALDTLPAIAFDSERKHEDFPGWSASLRFGVAGAGL